MGRFEAVLWDVDGTLLDFLYAQRIAIGECLQGVGIEPAEEILQRYSEINDGYWKRLELGEVTKEQLLTGRFTSLFEVYGITGVDVAAFRDAYESRLGQVFAYQENSLEVCHALRGKVKQYVITNGITEVQMSKIRLSGFEELMDGIFISGQVGIPKPQKGFFDYCLGRIAEDGITDKRKLLIVGDSLTSDIKGGVLSGIPTCWYRPEDIFDRDFSARENYGKYKPDFEISHLMEINTILEERERS